MIILNKDMALHDIALHSSKAFIESNMTEYKNSKNGFNLLVSDFTSRYIEAYHQAEKEINSSNIYV